MFMEALVLPHVPCSKNVLLLLLMICSKDIMLLFSHMVSPFKTGSGKTYTMGTGLKDGYETGIIPQVMNVLFYKIETLKHQIEFQLHVSFIEILKEEVRDLLDPSSMSKPETANGHAGKVTSPGKPPIQICETSNDVITLAGSTEVSVTTQRNGCLPGTGIIEQSNLEHKYEQPIQIDNAFFFSYFNWTN